MIVLDTNYLINALIAKSPEAEALLIWYSNAEVLCAPSIVWYEFLCGPVSAGEIGLMRGFLNGGLLSYGEREAFEAARLFNAVGRPRRLRVDAMIAACVLTAQASLATNNHKDFQTFVPHGLRLILPQ